jgi:hypothetical protein
VIDRFPAALADVLRNVNRDPDPDARLRMRLAVHYGLVQSAAGGYAGNGVVTAARMVNSDTARNALRACPTADLVVLLSSSLYNDVVVQRHTTFLSTTDFREVTISNKTFHSSVWLHIPGHDVHRLQLDEPETPGRKEASAFVPPPAQVSNVVHELKSKNTVFGVQNRFG